MGAAVASLYAFILRFLIRARDWYEEGKVHHFIHSITRPVELRYNDLLERTIDQLAETGQLVEFRDMHKKIEQTSTMMERLSSTIACEYAVFIHDN